MTYLEILDVTPKDRKTKIFKIWSLDEDLLGEIRFWGPWRQYTFQPEPTTVFDTKCLTEINEVLVKLNTEIRNEWKERKKAKL